METKSVGSIGPSLVGNSSADRLDDIKSRTDDATREVDKKKLFKLSGFDVQLSPEARDLAAARAKAHQIANDTPDIREDRVAELKAKIEKGEYKVDPEKIADGMMREAIKDRLATIEE